MCFHEPCWARGLYRFVSVRFLSSSVDCIQRIEPRIALVYQFPRCRRYGLHSAASHSIPFLAPMETERSRTCGPTSNVDRCRPPSMRLARETTLHVPGSAPLRKSNRPRAQPRDTCGPVLHRCPSKRRPCASLLRESQYSACSPVRRTAKSRTCAPMQPPILVHQTVTVLVTERFYLPSARARNGKFIERRVSAQSFRQSRSAIRLGFAVPHHGQLVCRFTTSELGRPFGFCAAATAWFLPASSVRSNGTTLHHPEETKARVFSQRLCTGQVRIRGQIGIESTALASPSSVRVLLRAIIETYNRDPHRRAVKYPRAVTPRHEDSARFKNALQYWPISNHANRVGCQQSRPLCLARLYLSARALKPKRHKVRASRHASRIQLAQGIYVFVAKLTAHFLVTQERRVADDEIHFRPIGFRCLALSVVGEDRIAVLNIIKLAQNRLCRPANGVLMQPLQITYPNHH